MWYIIGFLLALYLFPKLRRLFANMLRCIADTLDAI